jgi:hypothetical protein
VRVIRSLFAHLNRSIGRVQASVTKRGVKGTAAILLMDVASLVRRRAVFALESAFDWWHCVDTRGITWQRDFGTTAAALEHATHYCGTYPGPFRRFITSLDIDYRQYSFIDLGSGKGKALLLAAEHPFKSITGVELAPRFCTTAIDNLRRARRIRRRCEEITVVAGDAATFSFPHGPLIVYLHNPFDAAVLEQVIVRLESVVGQGPQPTYVVYHGPRQRAVLERVPWLRVYRTDRKCVVYEAG